MKLTDNLSIILPCWNEEKRIYDTILRIHSFIKGRVNHWEIIVADDGSTDQTSAEVARAQIVCPGVKLLANPHRGKGGAVRAGILASQYDPVMFLDADLAIPIEETEKFIKALNAGNDLVIASRFVRGLNLLIPVPWYRKVLEDGFRILRMILLSNFAVHDTQCGFKMFRRPAAQKIFGKGAVDGWAFDSEVIFLATKMGYRIRELPVALQNRIKDSRIRIFSDPLKMLGELFRIRWNSMRGKYQ